MSEQTSFWARRKAAVAAEAEAQAQAVVALEEAERVEALEAKDDAEILEELGLPDPTQMQQGDDFSAFMARGVPERLRKQALRTLWRSNPVLACVDGLNDYDDDYRAAALLQEPFKTSYQVGKGMLAHLQEMERQAALGDEAGEANETAEDDVSEDAADAVVELVPEAAETAEAAQEMAFAETEVAADQVVTTPRKMRFRFEGATG